MKCCRPHWKSQGIWFGMESGHPVWMVLCYTSNRVARVCLHQLSFLFSHSHGAASNPAGFSAPSATFRSPFSPTAVQLSRTQLIRRSRAVESVPWCRGIRLFSKSCLICSVVRWNTARKQSCASDASGILDNSRGAAASGADATVYADDDDGDAVMVVSNVMSPSTAAAVALIAAGFNSDMWERSQYCDRAHALHGRAPAHGGAGLNTSQVRKWTSCAGGRQVCPRSLQVDNIFVYIRQMAGLFRHVGCLRHQQVDLWHFDLDSGVRVTCDVGYLCAIFSIPGPLCSRLRPDVRDERRQTDDRRVSSLNAPPIAGGA